MGWFGFGKKKDAEAKETNDSTSQRDGLDHARMEKVKSARSMLVGAIAKLDDPENQISLMRIARKEVVVEVHKLVKQAIQELEELGLAKELNKEENLDLKRLKETESAAKMDPARFKRIFTEDKNRSLQVYQLRVEIAAQIQKAVRRVEHILQKHQLHEKAEENHSRALAALNSNNLSAAYRLCQQAQEGYARSGIRGQDEGLEARVLELSAFLVQKVFRGHRGRKAFRQIFQQKSFDSMRWRLEAASLFEALDADRSGSVTRRELAEGLARAGFTSREANAFFDSMDADASEEILLDEFLEAFRSTLFSGQHSLPSLANSESAEKKAASPRRSNLHAPPEQLQVDKYGRVLEAEKPELPDGGGGTYGPRATGCTSLKFGEIHYAAQKGDVVRIWGLVCKGRFCKGRVGVNCLTSNGFAALHFAAIEDRAQAILTLGALGADADLRTALGYTAMHAAASRNNKASILALAQIRGSISVADAVAEAHPLHWAARHGQVEALDTLLELGAHPEVVDRGGNSALLYAARNGHLNVLQRLVGVGANIAAVNRDGKDALDLAAEMGHTAAALKLLQLGLPGRASDSYRGSAASLAELKGHTHTAAAIRNQSRLQLPLIGQR